MFLGRILLTLERGRQRATSNAGNSRVRIERVRREWDLFQNALFSGQFEARRLFNNLRSEALGKAPTQWNELANLTVQFWDDFQSAVATGKSGKVISAFFDIRNRAKEAYSQIRKAIASQN